MHYQIKILEQVKSKHKFTERIADKMKSYKFDPVYVSFDSLELFMWTL